MSRKFAVAAIFAFAAVALVSAAIIREDAIEWSVSDSQIAFWSKRSAAGSPILITLPRQTSASEALFTLARKLAIPNREADVTPRCRFVETATNIIAVDETSPDSIPLADLLLKKADKLSVHCNAGASQHPMKWELSTFIPPVVDSNRKWIGSSEYPNNAVDLVADTLNGVLHWAVEFLAVHWGDLHPFQAWTTNGKSGRFNLNTGAPISVDTPGQSAFAFDGSSDSEVRLALTADWGSGTKESAYVSELLTLNYDPQWTIHIGDVYYLGAAEDFRSNVFGIPPAGVANGVTWPHGSFGSFGLCGNHEMYSRGQAYYDMFLPSLGVRNESGQLGGQDASYFSLENEYWRVISLDTGYNTYSIIFENNDNPQPAPIIDWLVNDVKLSDPTDTRGIIFFSHHQTLSAFGKEDKYLATPKQIVSLLPPNRTVLWLWGHEHRVSFYDFNSGVDGVEGLNLYGRCIGNGGYPTSIGDIPDRAAETNLKVYDDRVYTVLDGFTERQIGFQGFQHLNFTGGQLTIDYKSLMFEADGHTLSPTESDLLVTETWTVDSSNGNVVRANFKVVNSNMTIVS